MVSVPRRLLSLPSVEVAYAGPDVTVVRKRLREGLHERPSSLSMHAASFVSAGEQVVYDSAGSRIRIRPGAVGLMRRDLYTITDLLAERDGVFATAVFFFSDAVARRALALAGPRTGEAVGSAPALRLLAPRATFATWPAHVLARARERGALSAAAERAWWTEAVAVFLAGALSRADLEALLSRPRRGLRDFMRAHYDKPLSVEDYAYLTGRSARSFRRDFVARFGESPKKWLVARRLERARELLRRGEVDSVSAVAEAVGYASVSHFIERYRGRYGETPGALLAGGLKV